MKGRGHQDNLNFTQFYVTLVTVKRNIHTLFVVQQQKTTWSYTSWNISGAAKSNIYLIWEKVLLNRELIKEDILAGNLIVLYSTIKLEYPIFLCKRLNLEQYLNLTRFWSVIYLTLRFEYLRMLLNVKLHV